MSEIWTVLLLHRRRVDDAKVYVLRAGIDRWNIGNGVDPVDVTFQAAINTIECLCAVDFDLDATFRRLIAGCLRRVGD